jgi:formylglycine-generating enzyme required for sulfatase activity
MALILVAVIYNRWPQQPAALPDRIDQARAALARGDTAAAGQALKQAPPELAAAFARDQAALYRELAQRAQTQGDPAKAELALAEAQRWETAAGTAPGPASAKAPDPPAQAAADRPLDKRQGPVGPLAQAMIEIPGGEFSMGCSPGDSQCNNDEKPPHRVKVKAFRMGKYEVTQAQWQAVMGENPARFKGDERPVEQVSWDDIQAFLKRLNAGNPNKPYRLPSEAEWEYAARAGTQTPYWWGKDPGRGNANCDGCGSRWDNQETAPVGSFKPNPFGLYDTAGNVWEWVQDCLHDNYQGAPTDGSEWRDNCRGTSRGLRGGSWDCSAGGLRVSLRYWGAPTYRYIGGGVRLAQDL